MRPTVAREYARLRAKGWHSANALRAAKVYFAFQRREQPEACDAKAPPDDSRTECVRLRCEPDECADFESLCGDCFNPRANPDIDPTRLEREREAFRRQCEREGVWGLIAEYWDECEQKWEHADSCWGFVGSDLRDNGYDVDLKASALERRTASVRRWRSMCKAAP